MRTTCPSWPIFTKLNYHKSWKTKSTNKWTHVWLLMTAWRARWLEQISGSLLDTAEDINMITKLAMSAFNKYKRTLTSSNVDLKTRLINAYITSIYSSYTIAKYGPSGSGEYHWLLSEKFAAKNTVLEIKWPYTISNENLYDRTSEANWSKTIKTRGLRWLGHMLSLHRHILRLKKHSDM